MLGRVVRWVVAAMAVTLLAAEPVEAQARKRHALLVGIADYKSGLAKLTAPPHDVKELASELAKSGYATTVLQGSELTNRAAFDAALARFLAGVQADDDVLFYFSGHGMGGPDRDSFLLLSDAKSEETFFADLGPAAREFDTAAKRQKRYQEELSKAAVSLQAVEREINARRPSSLVVIVDACRDRSGASKSATLNPSGLVLPVDLPTGTYRILSALPDQVSWDTPDSGPSRDADGGREAARDSKRMTSLFTRVLIQELQTPGLEINTLFKNIKVEVRERARNLGRLQVPEFQESTDAAKFFFRNVDATALRIRCASAADEIDRIRLGVAQGGMSRDELLRRQRELAPCGNLYTSEIDRLLNLESQGGGALSTTELQRFARLSEVTSDLDRCDGFGSSPFDQARPQTVRGFDVYRLALDALKAPPAQRTSLRNDLTQVVQSCRIAVQERPRVARYKFNHGRANYALAMLIDDADQYNQLLTTASRAHQEAAELGYVAAYNDLAVLHQTGEYRNERGQRERPDRGLALEYFRRGAELGHVLAQYNLGMAFKNGELGLVGGVTTNNVIDASSSTLTSRIQFAFQNLSKAAEAGHVPAMIETALLLAYDPKLPGTTKRGSELLEIAASRGSWEAMYQLGELHSNSARGRSSDPAFMRLADELPNCARDQYGNRPSRCKMSEHIQRERTADLAQAVVWYSRAAEAGDSRAQTTLAELLMKGDGLPAEQPAAAARYLRLAAAGGSTTAQRLLADQLAQRAMLFRPRVDDVRDQGAEEIRELYMSAFVRGDTRAGLEFARLLRAGYPANVGSRAIPKSPDQAAELLWRVREAVRSADPASDNADPRIAAEAAFELIGMANAREIRSSAAASEEEIARLKETYGEETNFWRIRTSAIGRVNCRTDDLWVWVWNSRRPTPPTDDQFDWFERSRQCRVLTEAEREHRANIERQNRTLPKNRQIALISLDDLGVPKSTRDIFKREYEAALKDKDKKQSFIDRMVRLANAEPKSSGSKRRK
jgi:TPR repeat protein